MSERGVAPYGSWRSPISSDVIVRGVVGLKEVVIDGTNVYWLESRPGEVDEVGGDLEKSGFDTYRVPEGTPKLPLMYSLRAQVGHSAKRPYTNRPSTTVYSPQVEAPGLA